MIKKQLAANELEDIKFMKAALNQAKKAYKFQEVPIGAVVINSSGLIIGKGYNLTETKKCQSYHAEFLAIENATKKIGNWRLDHCVLYVTLEPCLMCMSLIGLSRIKRIVFGTKSPLFGYHLDKEMLPDLYKKQLQGITSGILADEAEKLLKGFFKEKRKKGE